MRLSFGRRCKFGEAKVAELDVTPSVIEDVGWLEILQVQVIALGVHSKDQEMCSSCFASLQLAYRDRDAAHPVNDALRMYVSQTSQQLPQNLHEPHVSMIQTQ